MFDKLFDVTPNIFDTLGLITNSSVLAILAELNNNDYSSYGYKRYSHTSFRNDVPCKHLFINSPSGWYVITKNVLDNEYSYTDGTDNPFSVRDINNDIIDDIINQVVLENNTLKAIQIVSNYHHATLTITPEKKFKYGILIDNTSVTPVVAPANSNVFTEIIITNDHIGTNMISSGIVISGNFIGKSGVNFVDLSSIVN